MIIPLGQEESTVRRHPWVTYALMITCLAAFLATHPPNVEMQKRAWNQLEEAFEYFIEHPYLELSAENRKLFFGVALDGEEEMPQELEMLEDYVAAPETPAELAAEQRRLEVMISGALEVIDDMPVRKYGLIPSDRTPMGVIGHMFLHGGWIHLLSNMFLLFICGPFLEDVWGRPIYGAFTWLPAFLPGSHSRSIFPPANFPSSARRGPSPASWGRLPSVTGAGRCAFSISSGSFAGPSVRRPG